MMDRTEALYKEALNAVRAGESTALVTVVEAPRSAPRGPGAKMLIYTDERTVGTVGGGPTEAWVIEQARKALEDGQSRLLDPPQSESQDRCGQGMRFFVDVLLPPATLLIVGAGHIGRAVASLGAWLGYRIVVLDERQSLVSPVLLPDADLLLSGQIEEELRQLPLTERTYAVLVTPHHSPDEVLLSVLAQSSVPYVGLLGGRRRTEATFERARDLGVPQSFLEQVHTPIGLDIQAETPREIALSILADVTAVRRKES